VGGCHDPEQVFTIVSFVFTAFGMVLNQSIENK
jgi:hypothetical protein